jgi:dihydrofolate reductase
MRRVKYSVAMSLDGYIAGPSGEHGWITMDPAIDFAAFLQSFDTVLMGRKTFEVARRQGSAGGMPGMATYVFSRTLNASDHPDVTIVADDPSALISTLRAKDGKDLWLMGGGILFRNLLGLGLVDGVEVAIIPVLLGGGTPLLPTLSPSIRLELTQTTTYPTGIVSLSYSVLRDKASCLEDGRSQG